MISSSHPALQQFIARLDEPLVVAQVLIRRVAGGGFDLRHVADRDASEGALRQTALSELRSLAQSTASGAFRPLKSAPNLRAGWRATAANGAELETVLNDLYPGALVDWLAAQSPVPPVTHYREFTGRQTGMYRITTMLDDAQAARMIRACCHPRFCLKQRLWTVGGLAADKAEGKSVIPCLEPCAVLLEFARKAMRLEQEEKAAVTLAPGEIESVRAALDAAVASGESAEREGDFGSASNPRRLQLLIEKLGSEPAT